MTLEQIIEKRTARINLLEKIEEEERALQDARDWQRALDQEFNDWLNQKEEM